MFTDIVNGMGKSWESVRVFPFSRYFISYLKGCVHLHSFPCCSNENAHSAVSKSRGVGYSADAPPSPKHTPFDVRVIMEREESVSLEVLSLEVEHGAKLLLLNLYLTR